MTSATAASEAPKRSKFSAYSRLLLKIAAVVAPSLASAWSVYMKGSAETAAGYHALKDTVESQGKDIDRLEKDIHEIRSAILYRAVEVTASPASPSSMPSPKKAKTFNDLLGYGGLGSGSVKTSPMVDTGKTSYPPQMQRPLPKSPKSAIDEGF